MVGDLDIILSMINRTIRLNNQYKFEGKFE